MSKIEEFILDRIKQKQYVLTAHARIRMSERLFTDADIINIAETATAIIRQEDNDTFLIEGTNTWEEDFSISVAVRKNIIIVTIFFNDERDL